MVAFLSVIVWHNKIQRPLGAFQQRYGPKDLAKYCAVVRRKGNEFDILFSRYIIRQSGNT